jgi:CHAD domain-containing protein
MPFHFKKKESVSKAVRRLCRERIDGALDNLKAGGRLEAVHNVRKEIKKMRAVLRLMRGEIGKRGYRKNADALWAAADHMTAMRDAQARLNAFGSLTKHFGRSLPARPFPNIKKALVEDRRKQEKRFWKGRSMASVNAILGRLKRQAGGLKTGSKGWKAVCPGLKKSFCRGREALEAVRGKPSPENFHEWRKRVKDLWYHLRLLDSVWPQEMAAATDELEDLGESLGDDHDLTMLAEFAAGGKFPAAEAERLNWLIRRRQKGLRSAAVKTGARFYSENPGRFCARMGNYWRIWRGER